MSRGAPKPDATEAVMTRAGAPRDRRPDRSEPPAGEGSVRRSQSNGAQSLQGDMPDAGSLIVRSSLSGRSATTGQSGRWNMLPVGVATKVPGDEAAALDAPPFVSTAAPSSLASTRESTSTIWRSPATMRVSQYP